ncbi:hypothetical protein ACIQAC_13605 [Streptomyces sp. NPDC088387]|uniref:hypothetical protein n=1 Tax=Streptomyces sp. NPDC088387 TaxID=3365859 RepID=UPI00382B7C9D
MKRVMVAGAVVAVVTGLAGCTSGGTTDGPPTEKHSASHRSAADGDLRAAERATGRAGSARVEATTGVGTSISLTSEGTLAWGDGLTGTLTITYTGGTLADTMRALGTTSMEARYLPDAYYARMGDKFAAQAGGKHWVKYPWDELDELGGASGAYAGEQIRSATPNQSVTFLLAADDVREVGRERVRGAQTTHYSGTAHVSDLDDTELRETLERAGVSTQTVDIWVDDRDLVVKKVEKGVAATGELTQTAYYADYGTEVSVDKPPAADTQSFKELLAQQGSGD